jgi:hypothetical protein
VGAAPDDDETEPCEQGYERVFAELFRRFFQGGRDDPDSRSGRHDPGADE